MKKVLCLMLVAMTVLALAIPMGALAERHSFRIYGVYCTSEKIRLGTIQRKSGNTTRWHVCTLFMKR